MNTPIDNRTRCGQCGLPENDRIWNGRDWVCYKCLRGEKRLDDLLAEIEKLKAERDMWKANHDNQVMLKRALTQRPDLGGLAAGVQALETKLGDVTKALTDIGSGSPALHRNGSAEHSCALCATHIALAREVLGWEPWPAIPWTVKTT